MKFVARDGVLRRPRRVRRCNAIFKGFSRDEERKIENPLARTKAEIMRCFPVMAELRPHLIEGEFVGRIRRQQKASGYQLALLEDGGVIKSLAGYRVTECLWAGRFFYLDDLVTAAGTRNQGCGQRMMDWPIARVREEGCTQLHLDSGLQRFEAHGFYLKNRLHIVAYHFKRALS
jgi:GNAT superfamily N-acetyltransferase